jgi:TonB family protein
MKEISKEKIFGIVGTTLFAVLLFLLLIFTYFKMTIPPQELEGIPVMFGSTENAYGAFESPYNEVTPIPTPQVETPPQPQLEEFITQNTEPTIDIEAQREEERRRAELEAERRRVEEAERIRREKEAQSRRINEQMSGLFGENNESRGNTEGTGTQGVSTGNSSQGSPIGTGGIGSFNLGGRSLGSGGLAQPTYNVNDNGTVVVNITVDPGGNVIHAEIGQGTNAPNASLLNEALRAARRTKFNSINSVNNQRGTITYRFNLN